MLSSDPQVSICLAVDDESPAWRASLAAALTACPSVAHEVVVLTKAGVAALKSLVNGLPLSPLILRLSKDGEGDRGGEVFPGLRILQYGPSTGTQPLWHALAHARGRTITLLGEPGVISRTLPERAHRRLIRHPAELIAPRTRTLPATPGFWEYGAELAPDVTSTALQAAPAPWSELPAVRALCLSFSRAHLDHLIARSGNAWLPDLLPEELSLRWWLCGGSIVCDSASSFSRTSVAGRRRTSRSWAQERLSIAALHLSNTRRARLQRYLEAVVPHLDTTLPVPLLEMRDRLFDTREHDDDWYCARFGFDVFDSLPSPVAVRG